MESQPIIGEEKVLTVYRCQSKDHKDETYAESKTLKERLLGYINQEREYLSN